MLNLYLSFCFFSAIASITPGPTNILALSNGQRAGVMATVPFVIGASAGTALILFGVVAGLAQLFSYWPALQFLIALAGALWLSYLAWQLWSLSELDNKRVAYRLSWQQGAAMQFINPKTWLMAISAASLFSATDLPLYSHGLLLAVIFFVVTCPCIAFWALLGRLANNTLVSPRAQLYFNRVLALVLALSIWWIFTAQ